MKKVPNKQQINERKQQAPRQQAKNQQEEFGAEFGFDAEQLKEEGNAAKRRQVSERTAWH